MIKWKRPSGTEIETNELPGTIEAAKAMGWERQDKPRRGRPPGSVNKQKSDEPEFPEAEE